ncbi:MAG: carboxymuconolactone decarboxylase family protein [Burkholderiaceae bacterium]
MRGDDAVLLDLEKCRYSYPGLDLVCHAVRRTEATRDQGRLCGVGTTCARPGGSSAALACAAAPRHVAVVGDLVREMAAVVRRGGRVQPGRRGLVGAKQRHPAGRSCSRPGRRLLAQHTVERILAEFDQLEKGFVPGLIWGRGPRLVATVGILFGAIDGRRSALSRVLRSLVVVRVSQINSCAFCIDINFHSLVNRSGSMDKLLQLMKWRQVASSTKSNERFSTTRRQ